MHLLLTLLHILTNPGLLVVVGLTIAALVAGYFIAGPLKVLDLIRDWRNWAIVIAAGVIASLFSLQHRVEVVQAKAAVAAQQTQATADSQTVLTHVIAKQATRQAETTRVEKAIQNAPQGDKLDSSMDEIARIQCSDPRNRTRPDCVSNGAGGKILP